MDIDPFRLERLRNAPEDATPDDIHYLIARMGDCLEELVLLRKSLKRGRFLGLKEAAAIMRRAGGISAKNSSIEIDAQKRAEMSQRAHLAEVFAEIIEEYAKNLEEKNPAAGSEGVVIN